MRKVLFLVPVLVLLCAPPCTPPAAAAIVDLAVYRFDPAEGEPTLPAELRVADGEGAGHGYYLIQTAGPILRDWRDALEAAGAVLYGYLPQNTFLAGLEPEAYARVAQLPGTRWIGSFHPAYKLAPGIGETEFVAPERADDPDLRLIVRIFARPAGVAATLEQLGITVRDYTDDGFSRRFLVSSPPGQLAAIARIPDVWWIEEQPEFRLMNNDTKWVTQSNVSGWTPLWDHGVNGEGQLATIMDSGVDYNTCWFREVGNAPPGTSHRKVVNYTIFGGGAAYDGCDIGHGTHVAGTMAGDQSYITGSDAYNGMAYKAKFTVQDVGADDWTACNIGTIAVPSSISSALTASYGLGARVHQNSWGSTSNAYDSYCVDVDNAMWSHKDFLVCFAAGNSGPSGSTVGSPGTAKNCVTVGACRRPPSQDTIASYSSRGPASDGRLKPTITAPGGEDPNFINSADNDPGNPPAATCQVVSSPFQGTSMATPCVSGMALNVRQYFTDGFYPRGTLGGDDPVLPQAALVKAVLVASTTDMGTADIPNNNEGWGRILMDDALFFEGDTRELMAEDVEAGLQTGQSWQTTVTVDEAGEPLRVTIVWTDYPASAGSGTRLVNDLDLTVTAPGGTSYRGNVFSAGHSVTGGSADRLNVEECVRIDSPTLGDWTIEVAGYNVPHGPQPFAWVLTGGFANWPPGDFSSAGDPVAAIGKLRISASPNPLHQTTRLAYAVPPGNAGRIEVTIVDVSGRAVRHLVAKGQRGGLYTVSWDGFDDARRPVADGVYFARLNAAGQQASTKIMVRR